jgi:hypothetical protein
MIYEIILWKGMNGEWHCDIAEKGKQSLWFYGFALKAMKMKICIKDITEMKFRI